MEVNAARFRELVTQSGLTHEEIAEQIGKSRLTITRTVNNRNVKWNTVSDIVDALNTRLPAPVDARELILLSKKSAKNLPRAVS